MQPKVSIIIPSRNCIHLNPTVEDIFANARGDIEVIVTLDGWVPPTALKYRDNLTVIYNSEARGLRHGINNMVRLAKGEWIFKCDDHCMFGEGFDTILAAETEPDWLVTPSRYSMDADRWIKRNKKVEYLYLTFPYVHDSMYGDGFHGRKWIGEDGIGQNMGFSEYFYMENTRSKFKIDDIQTIQGSGWFMSKEHFRNIGGLDEVHSRFYQEANELCFKTWMSGGRCVVNKNTWYAHFHKDEPSGFGMRMSDKRETQRFSTWVWMNNKWPRAKHDMTWFVDKFNPPTWPKDWKSHVKDDSDFKVFDEFGRDGFFAVDR